MYAIAGNRTLNHVGVDRLAGARVTGLRQRFSKERGKGYMKLSLILSPLPKDFCCLTSQHHAKCISRTDLLRLCAEWQPRREKSSRGRPCRRWQDDITRKKGTTWIRKATDRRQWKTLMEGYILQWMDKA